MKNSKLQYIRLLMVEKYAMLSPDLTLAGLLTQFVYLKPKIPSAPPFVFRIVSLP